MIRMRNLFCFDSKQKSHSFDDTSHFFNFLVCFLLTPQAHKNSLDIFGLIPSQRSCQFSTLKTFQNRKLTKRCTSRQLDNHPRGGLQQINTHLRSVQPSAGCQNCTFDPCSFLKSLPWIVIEFSFQGGFTSQILVGKTKIK